MTKGTSREIDFAAVEKLIHGLERDLAKVRGGSSDVRLLQDEVETLKNVLSSPVRRHHWVREALDDMRRSIERGVDEAVADGFKASQYLAEIGRILGL